LVWEGKVKLEYMNTKEMIADMMIKAVPKSKLFFCARGAGLNSV
jgi:hypothetical protein